MRRINFFLLLLIIAQFYSCKDNTVAPVDAELNSVEEVKQYLSDAKQSGILIIGIEQIGKKGYRVTFEDGSAVLINYRLILDLEENRKEWLATFYFEDSTSFQAPLLGDKLPISESDIELNPNNTTPLTAVVRVDLPVEGKFSVEVKGRGTDGISISNDFEQVALSHLIPILGLYPNHGNEVVLTFKSPGGDVRLSDTITITTTNIPISPSVNIVTNNLPAGDDDLYFVSDLKAGFDQRGDIRWIYTGDAQYIYRKMDNGNLLLTSNQNLVSYHAAAFMEVTMLGGIIREYPVPNRIHHEVRKMPNSNFLVASNSNRYEGNGGDGLTEEGVVVEIDSNSGEVIREWDFNQILDTSRSRPPGGNPDDLLHINTAYYDETDDSIVISSKHQSTIAKVDYETGEIIWLLAHPNGWGESWQPYVLQPVNSDGSEVDFSNTDFYPYFQHAPMRLSNGNILLYDNGNYRNFYNGPTETNYSRAVEYEINLDENTVEMVWEFNYNRQLFTAATGDVDILKNGNRLIGFMWGGNRTPKIVELNSSDEIVFDMEINPGEGNYYRTEKFDLYTGL